MQKKDFLELADKFKKGECNDEEKSLLFEFCDRAQIKALMDEWSLSDEEESRIRLLRRVLNTVDNDQKKRKSKERRRKLASVAAIFIGLIAIGFLYTRISSNHKIKIPNNAITLELEDGTIEIIEEDGTARVLDKNGTVVGQQNGNQLVYKPADGQKDLAYNTLTVPYGKRFELLLSDGTKAHLNAGTSLKYPTQFLEGMSRQVFITGEAYLEVKKDTEHPFIVNTSDMNVRVLGTQFNIHAYPEDGISEVVLVEGSVGLYASDENYDNERSTLLEPGYKASFDKISKGVITEKVLTNIYTSWRDGELVFRNMTFDNILKKLERHYDVTIINNNRELSDKVFNASFGKVPVETVFENLKTYRGINSTVEGKVITIQ